MSTPTTARSTVMSEREVIADGILRAAIRLQASIDRLPDNKRGRKQRRRRGTDVACMRSIAQQVRDGRFSATPLTPGVTP